MALSDRRGDARRAVLAVCAALVLAAGAAAFSPLAPPPALAAECNGDECQSPPPAPEEPIPGTAVVEGPPNPPVRFPKHHPSKHGTHRRHRTSRRS